MKILGFAPDGQWRRAPPSLPSPSVHFPALVAIALGQEHRREGSQPGGFELPVGRAEQFLSLAQLAIGLQPHDGKGQLTAAFGRRVHPEPLRKGVLVTDRECLNEIVLKFGGSHIGRGVDLFTVRCRATA
ncbi:hypothetical protein [Streptomyces sp. HNM1019]|uniref:hypothetical protein n=1 Tax=Streptomyces sp. HNM1019 TaxID=3424717 RepID=UPI003D77941C